ncbi:MAG TPA: methylamine dehydrogenase accessory protein MauD [Myxococcota bacterium]|jgi:methylamine dehydrogenase accessory protein MauD|nr:methylamine dehydrogenase accessory protein MauD [Myxococcota bacterium]
MSEALVVSNVLLWIAVVVLGAVVLALVRQLGVLHERIAPVGALALGHGPRVGEAAPLVHAQDLDGGAQAIGGAAPDGRDTLVFFLSPGCPVCKALLPALRSLARRESASLRVVLASDGPRAEHEAFLRREGLDFPYLLSAPLGVAYRVGKLPWAVLIDAAGVLRAQGLVNTREHLESLFEAKARGVASIQEHFARERGAREVRH